MKFRKRNFKKGHGFKKGGKFKRRGSKRLKSYYIQRGGFRF